MISRQGCSGKKECLANTLEKTVPDIIRKKPIYIQYGISKVCQRVSFRFPKL